MLGTTTKKANNYIVLTMCQIHSSKHFISFNSFTTHNNEAATIIIPILQMGKPKHTGIYMTYPMSHSSRVHVFKYFALVHLRH